MSWRDSMRLRGRADRVRFIGWINLAITFLVCVIISDAATLIVGTIWSALVMGLVYGLAYFIDKRAERVVGR